MDKDYLIKKWLTNTLTDDEWELFRKQDDYDLHLKLSEKAKNFKASDFVSPANFETLKNKLASRPSPSRPINRYRALMGIAAMFVLTLGIYFTFFANNLTHVATLAGEKTVTILPDASEVRLNAVSEIEFNQEKWQSKRELMLKGEAYFKVSKGSLFDVITDVGKISVLGTQFNVKNRQGYFEVVCYEGSVGVTYKDTVKKLYPGNVFRVLHGEVSMDTIDNIQPHWLQNISNFIQVPFFEVVQELERQYNVKVDTKAVNTNRIFKGGFVHGDLEKALESITKPLGLTYIIQNQNSVVLKNSE